jgi:hypothetical protein
MKKASEKKAKAEKVRTGTTLNGLIDTVAALLVTNLEILPSLVKQLTPT